MPIPLNPSGLRDNHAGGVVDRFLQEKIHQGSLLSVVFADFTMCAYVGTVEPYCVSVDARRSQPGGGAVA
jgi:hypothetical protein